MSVNKSLISINDLNDQDVQILFDRAAKFKQLDAQKKSFKKHISQKTNQELNAFLIFAEPSTRTRVSFQVACNKLGISPVVFSELQSSSIAKGESLEETFRVLQALNPSVIIFRYKGANFEISNYSSIPVISAGFDSYEHPTQALIDAFTIMETRGKIKGEKVLIIGDVLHSRVSNSNVKLLKRLGADLAFCSPSSLFPKGKQWENVKHFKNINEGVKWANVVMCLRVQQERHDMNIGLSIAEYRDKYHLGTEQMKILDPSDIILHPGPCILGVEMSLNVFNDKRSHIMTQVINSVYIRSAVLFHVLDFQWIKN